MTQIEVLSSPAHVRPSFYPSLVHISMARRLPPCHCPEWLATVEDIGQIYGWWLGEVELTFDPLSTLPLSVYPWREDSRHAIAQSGWRLPLPRVAGETVDLGEVFSKAPEQAKFISRDEDRDIVQPLSTLSPSHARLCQQRSDFAVKLS